MIAVFIGGAIAMMGSLFGTRYLIGFFRRIGRGQPILGKEDLGPTHHMAKQGTPTMGGAAIVIAAFLGWFVAHLRHGLAFSNQALIMWACLLYTSDAADDYS
jgi:phospho-N-acetylmuramoyl-pentapeptide-transferase